jgi:hypothetical protein
MKITALLMLLAMLCVAFMGCTEQPSGIPTPEKTPVSTATTPETTTAPVVRDLAELNGEMKSKFNAADSVDFTTDLLLNMYGIKAEDVAELGGYMTLMGVFPEEIIMIKASSEEAKAAVVTALEKRIAEVKVQSQNYDAENYALAQKCGVKSDGLYVTLFISPNVEEMTNMFYKG